MQLVSEIPVKYLNVCFCSKHLQHLISRDFNGIARRTLHSKNAHWRPENKMKQNQWAIE